jgi:type I restriction enzyme S subunit
MNLKWQKIELGELIDTLKGCAFKSKDYVFEGIPIVRVSDFTKDSISEDNLVYLPEALAEEYSAYKLQHNNIVIQTVGSWQYNPASVVGKVIKVPRKLSSSLLNQNAVKLIPKHNIDERFLYYRLKDDTFKAHVLGCAQGAANQASITLTTIKRFKFFLPSLEFQQKIAVILSAYDDLIENNLKRIKLLEEMAQITYEEWFVRLKFPGHETTPMDSETGLPVGWEKTTCFGLMDVLSGGTPKTDVAEFWDGNIKFFTPKDAANCVYTLETEKTITELGLKKCNSKLYPKNTIFITARGTVGKLNLAREAMAMNQSCYALIAKNELSQLFLFCALNNAIGAFKGAANGGVFDAIVVDTFRYISMTNPDEELIGQFDSAIKPIFKQIDNLIKQNQLLNEARDILLPRLMTGMIDVEQLVLPEPFSNTPSSPEQEPQAA